jgi:hypothetical protein
MSSYSNALRTKIIGQRADNQVRLYSVQCIYVSQLYRELVRPVTRTLGCLCSILAISVKLAKAVFLVPTRTT